MDNLMFKVLEKEVVFPDIEILTSFVKYRKKRLRSKYVASSKILDFCQKIFMHLKQMQRKITHNTQRL